MKSPLILAALLMMVGCQSPTESAVKTPSPALTVSEPKETPEEPVAKAPDSERLYAVADLATAEIKINGKALKVWLMDDPGKRQEGMMFLKATDVPKGMGMLFVFPSVQAKGRGFWMHNTLIPLDITYISAKGRAMSTVTGKPQDDTNLPSKDEFQFVLELPAGEAVKRGIRPGTQIAIPTQLAKNAT